MMHICIVTLLVMGVAIDEVDFVYDSGTTSGVAGINEKDILFDVEEEHVMLEGVGSAEPR